MGYPFGCQSASLLGIMSDIISASLLGIIISDIIIAGTSTVLYNIESGSIFGGFNVTACCRTGGEETIGRGN